MQKIPCFQRYTVDVCHWNCVDIGGDGGYSSEDGDDAGGNDGNVGGDYFNPNSGLLLSSSL